MNRAEWTGTAGMGVFLVAFGASLWGTDAVIRQPLTGELSSTSIVFAEHIFLMLFAIPVLLGARGFFGSLDRRSWLALLFIGWGGSALATVLFTEGFARGNPTTVILLQKTQPMIVIILAALILKERLPRLYWPCFAVALVGTYMVSFGVSRPWTLDASQVLAAALAVGAATLWGGSTVMGRFLLGSVPFSTLAAARFTVALPFLGVLALIQGDFVPTFTGIGDYPVRLFLLALIPGLLAMLIYYRGLSLTRASYATIAELAFPATAVVVNWVFLDWTISAWQMVGFVLLWSAITAISRLPAPAPREARAEAAVPAS